MTAPPTVYDLLIEAIAENLRRARALGLYRTGEKLHTALNEARSERFEAQPNPGPTITWQIGPITEQD